MAKGMSSGYQPISATVVNDELYRAFVAQSEKIGVFSHGFTYSGHPVACAVALETLKLYEERNILDHVRGVIPIFQERLSALSTHPLIGEVRGVGLLGAVELVRDKVTKAPFEASVGVGACAAEFAQDEGLILRAITDNLALCPPLIISEPELHEKFDCFGRALDRTQCALKL